MRLKSLLLSLLPLFASAESMNLLPVPKSMVVHGAELLSDSVFRFDDPLLKPILPYGREGMTVATELVESIPGTYDYELAGYPDESYRLTVASGKARIQAVTPTGLIRGAQTLAQLAATGSLKPLEIVDWPAFKVRGYMHDVGRDFLPVETLLKHLRLLARFKVNTFHWHLTENQAWRLEIKSHPELTEASTMTRRPGKYYTADDVRRVMDEAARYGMIVIPEIDMPGHSAAFVRATGHEMQSPEGMAVLRDVLREVAVLFAESPYIHIGADEQKIDNPDFLPSMTDFVHGLGKKVVVWNPIMGMKITKDSGFDVTQMWSAGGDAVPGVVNIDSRFRYTNHLDVFADMVGLYKNNIYRAAQGTPEIAGIISATWNDRRLPSEDDIVNQNNFYAYVLATTERAWKGGGNRYIEEGGTMLPASGPEFEEFADFERRLLYHKDRTFRDEPFPYKKQTDIRWLVTDSLGNRHVATGAGIYLRHTWGDIVPSILKNARDGQWATAVTHVYSPVEQDAGAIIEFMFYSRSEPDRAPDNGKWDLKGSRIWLNGDEIMPPVWENSGRSHDYEDLLLNENFTAREPVKVHLNKGWNEVKIYLPYKTVPGIRLNKWMFTFMLTDLEGRDALPGLFYSPYDFLTEK